ncbi:hypothetical protein NE237_022605 [Protea cynaroides]|uniref:RING-type domain-containing protein n=1 Tax=Protea cynaroides TaxID=273540 RepID=A0A9Q0HCC6_9MAGN|nr:hypothetical protein NE237_022605 [Protea cynaroides]
MICLGLSQSRINVAAIIFYTCVLIPLHQLKEALLRVCRLMSNSCEQDQHQITLEPFYVDLMCLELDGINHLEDHQMDDLPLPMVRFKELETKGEKEVCSVCLVEFEKEDEVTQLSRCGHVFHLCCIKSWVDRNRFTCPLCRCFLINVDVSHRN